jgi:predicted membrane protein
MGIFTLSNLFYKFANVIMYLLPFLFLYQNNEESSVRARMASNDEDKQILLIIFIICTSIVHLIIIYTKLEREIIQKEIEKETLKKLREDGQRNGTVDGD